MLVYPIPHAVTQARVQLVADQTERAPSHVIQADVLNVHAAKNEASRQALARAGMSIKDMDLYEINEAFAAQVLPSADDLGMDFDKLNVHGGAIALGHPFGSTGARITTTLLNGLEARDGQFGLETMCVGGGQGMAIIYERLS